MRSLLSSRGDLRKLIVKSDLNSSLSFACWGMLQSVSQGSSSGKIVLWCLNPRVAVAYRLRYSSALD